MSKIVLIDTHCHYNMEPLNANYHDIIKNDDILINIIGTTAADSQVAFKQALSKNQAWCSVGIHPTSDELHIDLALNQIETLLQTGSKKICAIGECGLDYYHPGFDRLEQIYRFKKQIGLAIKYHKTLVLHIRDAHHDAIKILRQFKNQLKAPVIIHCYTDNLFYAKQYEAMGFYISISGIVTFKKSEWLREIVQNININQLLTETDAPWLSPEPYRGKVNNSLNMEHINKKIAEIKGMDFEEINKKLIKNAFLSLKLSY